MHPAIAKMELDTADLLGYKPNPALFGLRTQAEVEQLREYLKELERRAVAASVGTDDDDCDEMKEA